MTDFETIKLYLTRLHTHTLKHAVFVKQSTEMPAHLAINVHHQLVAHRHTSMERARNKCSTLLGKCGIKQIKSTSHTQLLTHLKQTHMHVTMGEEWHLFQLI